MKYLCGGIKFVQNNAGHIIKMVYIRQKPFISLKANTERWNQVESMKDTRRTSIVHMVP